MNSQPTHNTCIFNCLILKTGIFKYQFQTFLLMIDKKRAIISFSFFRKSQNSEECVLCIIAYKEEHLYMHYVYHPFSYIYSTSYFFYIYFLIIYQAITFIILFFLFLFLSNGRLDIGCLRIIFL